MISGHRTAQDGRPVRKRREASWVTRYAIVLIGVAVFQLFPLVWLLLFSLKTIRKSSIFLRCPSDESALGELREGMGAGNISVYFLNSVWITVVATALTVIFKAPLPSRLRE